MSRYIYICLILFPTFSMAGDIGGFAGSFLRLGTSARSLAMGNAMTASVDRGFSGYHNPASVVFLEKSQLSVLHHVMPLDRFLASVNVSFQLPPTAGLSLAFVNSGVQGIDGRDNSGHHTETFSTSENAIFISFANQFVKNLGIGVNVKVVFQSIPHPEADAKGKSRGTGFDVGLMYRGFKNFDIGFALKDYNTAYNWNTDEVYEESGQNYQDRFPMQVKTGINYHPKNFNISVDYVILSGNSGSVVDHRIMFGGEYEPIENVFIRGGLNDFVPAVGAGLNYSLFNRNDAFVDYAVRLGKGGDGFSHIFTYVFTF